MVTSAPSVALTRMLDTSRPKTVWYVSGGLAGNVAMPHLAMHAPGVFAYDRPFLVTPDVQGRIEKIAGMTIGYHLLLEELCRRGVVKHISVNNSNGCFSLTLFVEAKDNTRDTLLNFINALRFILAGGEGIASIGLATVAREAKLKPSDLRGLDLNDKTSIVAAQLLNTAELAMSSLLADCALALEFNQTAS